LDDHWHFLIASKKQTSNFTKLLDYVNIAMGDHIIHNFRIYAIHPSGQIVHTTNWNDPVENFFEVINTMELS